MNKRLNIQDKIQIVRTNLAFKVWVNVFCQGFLRYKTLKIEFEDIWLER